MKRIEKRLFEKKEYNQIQDIEGQLTENTDYKVKLKKKKDSETSAGTDDKIKSENQKEASNQEPLILIKKVDIDLTVIPDFDNSKNSEDILGNDNQVANLLKNETKKEKANFIDIQNHEINRTKSGKKKIFNVITPEIINSTNSTKHSKDSKDDERTKVCRMSMNAIFEYLNYRCGQKGLHLKKLNGFKLFGNVRKSRWCLKRKIKMIVSSKSGNKKVVKQMIKEDLIFKKFVELKYEDFYKQLFIVNKRYLPIYGDISIFMAHFDTFKDCLKKEKGKKGYNRKYGAQLRDIGNNFIKDINGEGDLILRCNQKRIKKKFASLDINEIE